MSQKLFIAGNEALARAARAAGAKCFYGYPITPSSEVAHLWAKYSCIDEGKKDGLVFVQAEDEIAAGFMLCGGVLAGQRSFTATAGPGHVLMQDGLSMAEAMRLPVVVFAMQRGGPSTSTVIYSQQEVTLACFGGNGNGYRIVYSPATPQELYDYGIKVFDIAWRYRFPTILLGDGYLGKMMSEVETWELDERGVKMADTEAYLLEKNRARPLAAVVPSPEIETRVEDGVSYDCLRNCLNMEEETATVNAEIKAAFDAAAPSIVESSVAGDSQAPTLIVAHGIVSAAAKAALDELGSRARLFRPITLRPFPTEALRQAARGAERIIVVESAENHLGRLVSDALCGHVTKPLEFHFRPGLGILPTDIVRLING